MEIESARDWIIVLVGALEIILIIGLAIVMIVVFNKINKLVKQVNKLVEQGKETIKKIEHTVTSPYYKGGTWIFKVIAKGLGLFQKKKRKGGMGKWKIALTGKAELIFGLAC